MATSSKRLTDTEIKKAHVPAGNKNPVYLRDPGNPGLYVRITPNGTRRSSIGGSAKAAARTAKTSRTG